MWIRVAIAILLAWRVSALAVPVLGNLNQPTGDEGVPLSYHTWQASSFRIGDTPSWWTVKNVSLSLGQVVSNRHLSLRITGEEAFRPNLSDVRVVFETPTIVESLDVVFQAKFEPTPRLEPNQTYWLVLGVDDLDLDSDVAAGLFRWSFAEGNGMDSGTAAGWSFGERTASAGTGGSEWTPEVTTPFSFRIDAVRNIPDMTLARWRNENPSGSAIDEDFLVSDDDRDGMNGLLEYAFDSNADYLPSSVYDPESAEMGLSYVRWSQAPELSWQLEMSTDFSRWESARIKSETVTLIGDAHERVTVILAEPADRVFLRLQVSR